MVSGTELISGVLCRGTWYMVYNETPSEETPGLADFLRELGPVVCTSPE